jgi:hypothetical protein
MSIYIDVSGAVWTDIQMNMETDPNLHDLMRAHSGFMPKVTRIGSMDRFRLTFEDERDLMWFSLNWGQSKW